MTRRIVSDTSPLISLEKIEGGFDLVKKLYDSIIIPPAVLDELSENFPSSQEYLHHYEIEDLIVIKRPTTIIDPKDSPRLHSGEIEAISLASDLGLTLLIEESLGRRVARSLGITISGLARQIVIACQKKIIDEQEAKRNLRSLLENHRINRKVYDIMLSKIR